MFSTPNSLHIEEIVFFSVPFAHETTILLLHR